MSLLVRGDFNCGGKYEDKVKPDYEEKGIQLYLGDCLEVMKQIPDKSIDLVLTDPPYNRGYFSENLIDFTFLDIFKNKLRDNKYIYCFWTPKTFIEFETEFTKRFNLLNIIIYFYRNKAGFGSPYKWQKTYEPLYFGVKGKPSIKISRNDIKDTFDVWEAICPQTNFIDEHKSRHPTQKPLKIIKKAIIATSKQNDLILDPFMGSGTTGVACKELGRNFIGIEIEPKYFEIAKRRINNAVTEMFV